MSVMTARASDVVDVCFEFGPQLVMNGLPIESAELGIPVRLS